MVTNHQRYGPVTGEFPDLYDASWKRLHQPDGDLLQLFAFQLSLLLGMVVLLLWVSASPSTTLGIDYATLVGACIVLAPLHELAHFAAFPRSQRTGAAVVTFRLSRMLLCTRYNGVLSRNRHLWMLGMPLLTISLVPVVAFPLLGSAPRDAVVLSLLNALVSGQDLLAMILVLAQVPRDAIVRVFPDSIVWRPCTVLS